MSGMSSRVNKFNKRASRVRYKLKKVAAGLPRLTVFKSNKYLYVQIIDDAKGRTLVSASTLQDSYSNLGGKKIKDCSNRCNVGFAKALGFDIAEKAKSAGVLKVVFDRGGYAYHGRVKAIADAAREGGLIL